MSLSATIIQRGVRVFTVVALLSVLIVGVSLTTPALAEGTVVPCPNPSTTAVLTLSYKYPTPVVTVHPGDSFTVIVPSWTWGPISKVKIGSARVMRRECSQLLPTGSRYEILFAASPGTTLLSATVPPRGNLRLPSWGAKVLVVMPPTTISTLPKDLTARFTRQGQYANPVASGTLITRSELNASLTAGDIIERNGYALVTLDGFEYPVVTDNGGQTWRVAGLWFAGPWADAGAFTTQMVTFSARVAVSYDQSGVVYSTSDAGRQWFATQFPSMIMRVTSAPATSSVPPAALVVTIVRMGSHGPTMSRYHSFDGGRLWTLL